MTSKTNSKTIFKTSSKTNSKTSSKTSAAIGLATENMRRLGAAKLKKEGGFAFGSILKSLFKPEGGRK
jgi:hypothetical protein